MPIVLDGTNGITQADQFNSDSTFGFKNRIINGAMPISQAQAGASTTALDSYPVDRFKYEASQTTKLTWQQNAGSVTPPAGFTNYLGATSSSAYSITSSDFFLVTQRIEGFNIADLDWGTANAKSVTLSFWVRSSLTGTFGGVFSNSAGNRSYPFSYSISAANTWEYETITIAGDTSGTWLTNNGTGITLRFGLGVGSTFSGTAGAWAGSSFFSATGAVSVVGTNGATWFVTGVQLEVGSTATSFDYRPYGTELSLCQRYYYLLGKTSTFSAMGIAIGADTTESLYISPLPVTMRATPSYSTAGNLRIYNGATRAVTSSNINAHATPNIPATTFIASGGGLAAGQGLNISANNDATAYIAFSAEL